MSAERGWIGPPQLTTEWHLPAWAKTGGRHFLSHRQSAARSLGGPEVSRNSVDDRDAMDGGR